MSTEPGRMLSHYRLIEKIGEGGMGVVWKAVDTTLGREVAIKVLPENFAGNEERLARFEREARVLASLNHPNVATLHGFEGSGGLRLLVMELVPGETLAGRISRGRIPLDEALPLFEQLAEALEAAHERGIIHRDLKPANIKVTPEGKVKVLDFGLAKTFRPRAASSDASPSMSPTVTSAGTVAGVILGTAAYMSPEQARGDAADKRADIWAFGVVSYEVLTGRRAFRGNTVSDTLAAVLKVEPDWDALPAGTPLAVRRLLRRCLDKQPKQRLHDIADARIEIAEAIHEPAPDPAPVPAARMGIARWRWSLTGALVGLVAGALFTTFSLRDSSLHPFEGSPGISRHFVIQLPAAAPLALAGASTPWSIGRPALAISPDGSRIVYSAAQGRTRRLFLRPLDSFEVTPIPGTEGAFHPFFSPDGEWVAFFTLDKLKKVSLRGGEPVVLCEAQTAMGGTWGGDGTIYFTHHEHRLARVPADGGKPEDLTDVGVLYPHALSGGRGLLATTTSPGGFSSRKDIATIVHVSSDGEMKTLIEGGYQGRYVPSGHLVFLRGGGLFAAPFDLDRLEPTGPPVSVLRGVWTDCIWAGAQYGVSQDGTLVYVPGGDWAKTVPTWIDRRGNEEPLPLPAEVYNTFELSPDRRRLAIQVTGAQDQIYVYDRARETFARLTLRGANFFPVWTRDGTRVVFASDRDGPTRMYWKPVDGSGGAERLMTESQARRTETEEGGSFPESASPDGRFLMFFTGWNPQRWLDVWLLPLEGEREPRPLVATRANDILASFSPDGRWIAFLSDKTGRYEVFVRPFPDVDRREWQVSSGGGDDPRWSPLGDQLFYRDSARLMSVRFSTDPDFSPDPPRLVLEAGFYNAAGRSFDVSADGERFLVNKPVISGEPVRSIHVVLDWFDELKRLAPDRGRFPNPGFGDSK